MCLVIVSSSLRVKKDVYVCLYVCVSVCVSESESEGYLYKSEKK